VNATTGAATCATSALLAGTDVIGASYPGDNNFALATAATVNQTINQLSPTLTISATTAANLNTVVTLTATLSGAPFTPNSPSGTVSFTSNGSAISCNSPATVNATTGAATCATSALLAGTDVIGASYPGDANFKTATAATVNQTINQLSPTLTISATTAANLNTVVTLSATLSGAPFTPTSPSGTVSFTSNGSAISCNSPATVNSTTGVANCATSALLAGTDVIGASYPGDANFKTATAATVNQTINQLSPTLTISATTAANLNTVVTLTATLSGAPFTPTSPSGTVSFTSNGSAIICNSPATVNSTTGVANCATSALLAGTDVIGASYPGDANFKTATAATVNQTINQLSPTLALTASPTGPITVGTTVTFTAQLGSAAFSPVAPTGTVTFKANGNPITCGGGTSPTVNAAGTAKCQTSALVAPADIITATYPGDGNFNAVGPIQIAESVGTTAANTVLASSNPSPDVNQSVTFTATVSAPSGTVVPTGSVTFTSGSTTGPQLCAPVPLTVGSTNSTAICNFSFTSVTAGTTIFANYSGDTNFSSGTAATRTEVVAITSTGTGLSSVPSSSTVNQQVAFTAVVTPTFAGTAVPTGTVTFTNNGTALTCSPSPSPVTVATSAGVTSAVCNVTFLSTNSNSVVARYNGDTNFSTSFKTTPQTVNASATTTTVVPSPTPSVVNQSVTFIATVTPASPGSTNPTGSVAFSYTLNSGVTAVSMCASAPVSTTGGVTTAVCTLALTSSGNYHVTALYSSGDANFTTSSGAAIQAVGLTSTTTKVVASPSASSVNQPVLFTATVTPATAGSTPPTQTVTFSYTTSTVITPVNLCASMPVSTTASVTTATCTAPLPATGSYTITATYSGDNNFASSFGTAQQTVSAPTTTVTLSSLPPTSTVNQAVSFAAVVIPGVSGSIEPTGTVTFKDSFSPTPLCVVTVSPAGTVAPCNATLPTAATHVITAVYGGDSNFSAATSAPLNQVVSATGTTTMVAAVPSPSSVNQPVTFTATVTPAITPFPGSTIPGGSVTFSYTLNGGTSVTMCTKVAAGTVGTITTSACQFTFPLKGNYTITAVYSGDGNFALSSISVPQTVNAPATTTAVVASPSPSAVNQQVTFTATVAPAVAGSTNPTGTVTFNYSLNGAPAVNLSCSQPVNVGTVVTGTAAVTTAQCTAPLPSVAPAPGYTITALYSGDPNFGASSGQWLQIVNPQNLKVNVTSSSAAPFVNQPLNFTAGIVLSIPGTEPTGTVTFTDTTTAQGTQLCAEQVSTAGVVPPCSAVFATAGTHSITAAYSGDANYSAVISSPFSQNVVQAPTSLTLSPLPPIVATAPVTFIATVTTSYPGAGKLNGTVSFTSSDGTLQATASCQGVDVGAATGAAACNAKFPSTIPLAQSAQIITATYSNDKNFSNSTSSFTQTVQNFAVANAVTVTSTLNATATTGPVILTQGYSTATSSAAGTDPFSPTQVQLVVTSSGGFIDTLGLTCQVTNSITSAVVANPSCTVSGTEAGANGTALTYTVTSAPSTTSPTPIGEYTVTLAATDNNPSLKLSNSAALTVYIVGEANLLSLAQGASGQENVSFNTFAAPASDTFNSVACGFVVPLVNGVPGTALKSPGITCTSHIPAAGIPITSRGTTTVAVTISPSSTPSSAMTAELRRTNAVSMAAFLGIPLFALMGWVGSRKSPRRNFFRFLGLILLLAGVSYASGCGGNFTSSSTTTSTGIAAGNYLVQVVGTDQNGVVYYAVIPLDVSSN
jgi:hypothetical protein